MKNMNQLECDKVIVTIGLPILYIKNMEMQIIENEHGSLSIKAVLKETPVDTAISNFFVDEPCVKVMTKDNKNVLFWGIIEKLEIEQLEHYVEVELWCYSYTVKLDKEKKKYSYQDKDLTYQQIIETIISKSENVSYIWNVEKERKIEFPIIQYEESDWEFLKRLASHFHTIIYPDALNDRPGFYFGMIKGKQQSIENVEILKYGHSRIYYKEGGYETHMPHQNVKYIECCSEKIFNIGDYFIYEGNTYTIYQTYFTFRNGSITYKYLLGAKGLYQRKKYYNNLISGLQLKGTVREREKENVFVQLDINQEEKILYSWPFVPETGNLCYCMPELGTRVILYLPTNNEQNGVILNIINESGEKNIDSNVQNRKFLTKYDKGICMYPQYIKFSGKREYLLLSDSVGIKFNSDAEITMRADKNIVINGEKVFIQAPLEIICKTRKSSIDMCRDFNFYAPNGVTTQGRDGSNGKNMAIFEEEKDEVESWKASFSAIAAVPTIDLARGDHDSIIDLKACGSVAKFAKGSTTFAMKEVMEGKSENDTSFSYVFRSMQSYTVKGGSPLPEMDN